jgi:hypothetical protein
LATAGKFQAIERGKLLSLSVAKPYRIGSVMIKQSLGYVMCGVFTRQDSRPGHKRIIRQWMPEVPGL